MEVLAISLGKNILKAGGRDRARMRQYAEHLDGYHLIILTRKHDGYIEEIHEGSLHLYPTNATTRIGMLIWALFIARKIIGRKKAPWVVTAQDPLEIGWLSFLIAKVMKVRLHVQVHGDYFSSPAWVGRSLFRRVRRFFARMLLRRAPAIRVVSKRIMESLIARGIPQERITVLPIRPELESFLDVHHTYRKTSPCTLLFIGRLAPEKNIQRIIRAFALILQDGGEHVLKIVGGGEEQNTLTSLVRAFGIEKHVIFSAWTEHVQEEMNTADIFLLASKHEAYALTLVEAMAAGLPVVTTDVGCVGEVVRDGVHGIVVGSDGDEAYADAIRELIQSPELQERFGRAGRVCAEHISEVTQDEYVRSWVSALKPPHERV
jgi:glycosyltransferase involved in cell wall biosynthesis